MPSKKSRRLPGQADKGRVAFGAPPAQSDSTDPATPAPRRRIQRIGGVKPARIARGSIADLEPLDPNDAAIPFDHVPYVPGDLRRVALMSVMMIVLIIIAAFVIPHIVGS